MLYVNNISVKLGRRKEWLWRRETGSGAHATTLNGAHAEGESPLLSPSLITPVGFFGLHVPDTPKWGSSQFSSGRWNSRMILEHSPGLAFCLMCQQHCPVWTCSQSPMRKLQNGINCAQRCETPVRPCGREPFPSDMSWRPVCLAIHGLRAGKLGCWWTLSQ